MPPVPPPTRPHSANPHIALNPSVFPASSSSSRLTAHRNTSHASFNQMPRETEWEDAWDSSSDKDETEHFSASHGVPIPKKSFKPEPATIAASWASASYQYITAPSPPHRPVIITSKTYTDGAPPPPPGTTLNGSTKNTGTKLTPGGGWEVVETAEIEEAEEPVKTGKEAVRDDVENILRGAPLVHSTKQ